MDKRVFLLFGIFLAAFIIVSSVLFAEVARLNAELKTLKRQSGEYSYSADWVTRFVGYNPVTSAEEARQVYLMLIDKAPRKSYWIIYLPQDGNLPLKLEVSDMGAFYEANGTFRNYAVDCPNARLTIAYNIFKNGTANLENIKTICPTIESQEYHEYQLYP